MTTEQAFVTDLVDEALHLAAEASPGPWSYQSGRGGVQPGEGRFCDAVFERPDPPQE